MISALEVGSSVATLTQQVFTHAISVAHSVRVDSDYILLILVLFIGQLEINKPVSKCKTHSV